MKNTLLIILLISLISCNNAEKKVNETPTINQEIPVEKELTVSMEFKSNKEDELVFMLNDVVVDEFQKKNIHIFEKIIPTTTSDSFEGSFGVNNISNKFIISLGKNELKEIEILAINFKYGDKSVSVSPKDLEKYFALSKFSVLDTVSYKITTRKVDNYHDPRLYMRKKLMDELTQ